MSTITHLEMAELEQNLEEIRRSPKSEGKLALIVRRPRSGKREVIEAGELSVAEGLVGDNWSTRSPDAALEPERQLTIMNARVAGLLAQDEDRWELFGDQLYIDLELSETNLPVGTRLAMGEAIIEVTPIDHTGCKKFAERFGVDAVKFVSTPVGKELRLRGMYAKVVQPGPIRAGDKVRRL
ncbi:MAG: MOSC domain-containing protein [Caldilineaceae bacterium SB0664_bin_27]|uniref:MOSC domain-containing protein n=1 Tax=Caldilineaceae bacterium SB0664_bin_27 TaxID=2605260 RepID=A0A6B0YNS2_9CHLR|nr:MOSC domain-containing protein [Caldilineaceae bacterium SB0664_bin_27]